MKNKNRKLTREQRAIIKDKIVDLRNLSKACNYARVSYTTVINAMYEDGLIKEHQIEKLIEYAEQ